jgi:hypothetical protein
VTPPRRPIKKKSRPKAAKTKPERKAKGKSKGAPKSTKAKSPPKPPGAHPEPTVESTKHGDQDKMYGGFVLRLYDHDMRGALPAVYDSELHKVIFDKPIKAAVATGTGSANVQDQDTKMVTKLRRHLWALGFWVFPRKYVDGVAEPEESDTFDWRTEWAVREFQIAAAMPNVATQDVKKKPSDEECKTKGKYLSTLSAKTNDQILREHSQRRGHRKDRHDDQVLAGPSLSLPAGDSGPATSTGNRACHPRKEAEEEESVGGSHREPLAARRSSAHGPEYVCLGFFWILRDSARQIGR